AAILAGLALLWVSLRAFARRRRGFAPFGVAAGRLRRLMRARARIGSDPEGGHDVARQAYRILHDAFNEAAGRAIFASQKERFLAAHPRFAPEAGDVRAFFERSEQAFFAVSSGGRAAAPQPPAAQGEDLAWLSDLARRLARLEQPGR
ncbi:MAG: hypothetical protein H0T52_17325, partial [Lautropia sp.]|nr:hypothetical protein [Lautropia sp.]